MTNPYDNILGQTDNVSEEAKPAESRTEAVEAKEQPVKQEEPKEVEAPKAEVKEEKPTQVETENFLDSAEFDAEDIFNDMNSEEDSTDGDVEVNTDDSQDDDDYAPIYHFDPRDPVKENHVGFVPKKYIPEMKERKVAKFAVDAATDAEYNGDIVLCTVRGTQQSVLAAIERMDSNILEDKERQIERWTEAVQNANSRFMVANDQLFEATIRNGSLWINMLNHGTDDEPAYKGPVSDRRGKISAVGDDGRKTSIALLTNMLKLGVPSYVPLYHTGIWIKLRTPTVAEFIALDEITLNEKINYGMLTRGQIFSNDNVVVRKHVVDFILDHVEQSTAPSDDPEYLKSIIKTADLDMLILGIMMARYPDGYPLVQTCTVDPSKCLHSVEGLVDLRTLSWVDSSALTEKQYKILNKLKGRLTEEELKAYQDEFKQFNSSRLILSEGEVLENMDEFTLKDGVIINFEMPTLQKDEQYGVKWVREIHDIDESAFKERIDAKKRESIVTHRIQTAGFNVYGQWIKSIEIVEGGVSRREVMDVDELNEIFQLLAGDVRYTDGFTKMFKRQLTDNLVHMAGIVNYACPNCGKKHDTADNNHHIILPIDMLATFFTLVRSSVRASFRQIIT